MARHILMRPNFKKLLGLDKPRQLLAAIAVLVLLHVAFPRYVVATGSMEPTIPRGSYVVASRLHLWFSEPTTNDIMVFAPYAKISLHPWMHRIAGIEGDPIDVLATSRPIKARFDIPARDGDATASVSWVPSGYFYQAGDALSSYHGLAPRDMIKAKVLFHFELPWSRHKRSR